MWRPRHDEGVGRRVSSPPRVQASPPFRRAPAAASAPAVLELPSPRCVARRAGAPSAMHQLGELLKRHRHCTRRAPAARSRGSSCHSGRRGPSSRLVAQHLRLPYHSHVPVGARANVAQTWGYAQASSTSTLCLRLVVGAARVAVSGEALGGGFFPGWGAARVTRAPRVESRRPADADACPVHGALSRPHSTASRLAC